MPTNRRANAKLDSRVDDMPYCGFFIAFLNNLSVVVYIIGFLGTF